MKSFWERWYPLILGAVFSSIILRRAVENQLTFSDSSKDILIGATTLSSITIGFLAASQAVLLSLDGKAIIVHLKSTRTYTKLLNYLMDAIHWSFILAILSSVGLALDLKQPKAWYIWPLTLWIYSLMVTALSCFRTLKLFNKTLQELN